MRILILGGSTFVGRAVAEHAVSTGHEVTLVNRGSSPAPPGTTLLIADRLATGSLAGALDGVGDFDLVVDTWSQAPAVVADACRLLEERAARYAYVSSRSVYTWPVALGADESAPVVAADPDAAATDYAADKRGGELAVIRGFPDRHLIARPGLILGPHENIGRLPYWLDRFNRCDPILAPAPHDRPLQYIDARDLACWLVDQGTGGLTGCFDTVSRRGHTTTAVLLAACRAATGSTATLIWAAEEWLTAREITGWVDLPIWAPLDSEIDGLHGGDTSAAHTAGLRCRPIEETVADTWSWLRQLPVPPRNDTYLSRERELELLNEWATDAQ
ncbi:MAG: NAD-dependent epimerase/dehydratase family protein [Nocardioides sp.]